MDWATPPKQDTVADFLARDLHLEEPYVYFMREEMQKYIPQLSLKTKIEMRENERGAAVKQTLYEDPKFDVEPKTIKERRTLLVPHSSGWRNFWLRLKFLFKPNVDVLRQLFTYETYEVEILNPKSTQVSQPKSIIVEYPFTTYGFQLQRHELRLRCAYNPLSDTLIIVYAKLSESDFIHGYMDSDGNYRSY